MFSERDINDSCVIKVHSCVYFLSNVSIGMMIILIVFVISTKNIFWTYNYSIISFCYL